METARIPAAPAEIIKMARMHRRYAKRRRRPGSDSAPAAPRHNPPLFAELLEFVGPGFGGFAGTRFATHVAMTQIAQRKPAWGKHAGAGASVGAFLLAWFLGHKVKFLAKYQMPITVGAAIAAIQSLLQICVPKIGWMVSDATPELAAGAAAAPAIDTAHLDLVAATDDPNEFTYNDEHDPGRYGKATSGGVQAGTGPGGSGGHQPGGDSLADLEIEDAIGQTANMGVFSN